MSTAVLDPSMTRSIAAEAVRHDIARAANDPSWLTDLWREVNRNADLTGHERMEALVQIQGHLDRHVDAYEAATPDFEA